MRNGFCSGKIRTQTWHAGYFLIPSGEVSGVRAATSMSPQAAGTLRIELFPVAVTTGKARPQTPGRRGGPVGLFTLWVTDRTAPKTPHLTRKKHIMEAS